ncbi:uncharacterized protein BJX67DRAFT_375912 [Aspergillus lucknowensis]|uniref:GED domain-containing protein n=1 Tax=Aspergillus lucknowensis TaxID=176173 RepID=A0ABR4L615_9EURO
MEHSSPNQIRVYLTRISSDFHNLVKAGVEGAYARRDAAFLNIDCDNISQGKKRKVITKEQLEAAQADDGQLLLTDDQMMSWVRKSERWGDISRRHVVAVVSLVSLFINSALAFTVKDPKARHNLTHGIETRHPITYNHYYTDNIQKARLDRSKKDLTISMDDASREDWNGEFHVSNSQFEISRLLTALQDRVVVDMTERACMDARTDLAAYYKVAMKSFVDNICRQVIERHILAKPLNVFSPISVSTYTDDDLLGLAAESRQIRNWRAEAAQLQEALEQSLQDLGV